MIPDKLIIRWAHPREYADVPRHYEICNYGGGINETDRIAIALKPEIVGAVRICCENNVKVLRGMQIKHVFQRTGIGISMLNYLVQHIEINGCYCLPYKHLVGFYGRIGFEEISPKDAPWFLAERLEKYHSNGNWEMTIMQVKK